MSEFISFEEMSEDRWDKLIKALKHMGYTVDSMSRRDMYDRAVASIERTDEQAKLLFEMSPEYVRNFWQILNDQTPKE